jgi:hypothetical protein
VSTNISDQSIISPILESPALQDSRFHTPPNVGKGSRAALRTGYQAYDLSAGIHGALKTGFSSLYGFTSDEKGIRHPLLLETKAQVDETDALYMLGSCAAFVSYLINKARGSGLIA